MDIKDIEVPGTFTEADWKLLDGILRFGARLSDCAEILGVAENTVALRIQNERGSSFSVYRDKKMAHARAGVLQKAWEKAMDGDGRIIIHLLKNWCGHTDKVEQRNVTSTLTDDEIRSELKEIVKDLGIDVGGDA